MPLFIAIIATLLIISCSSSIEKSGIIESDKFANNLKGFKKTDVINTLGDPSSIDNLNNSFIYISETVNRKSIFNNKILSRNIYVVKFDNNNNYLSTETFNIDQNNEINITKNTTSDEILKTGLIETIFGGVGKKQSLQSIPKAKVGD